MDNFKRMMDEQFAFLLEVDPGVDRLSVSEKLQKTKDMVLHGTSEWMELLNEVKWKTWLNDQPSPPDIDSLTEEAVDVFKFVLNVLLLWGVTPEDFVEAFMRKSEVNVQRHLQHRQLSRIVSLARRTGMKTKVAALDLDGVLAAYPEHWLEYLERHAPLMRNTAIEEFSLVTGVPGIPREEYTKLKHRYRSTGEEVNVPPLPGAVEFTHALRAQGYQIVIVSARPVDRYKRLYSDSIRWLRKHDIAYDAVLWDSNKEDRIIKDLPIVDFVLDDDPTNVERLVKAGINAFLFDRPYNRQPQYGELPRVLNRSGVFLGK